MFPTLLKYLLEGLGIGLAAWIVMRDRVNLSEILIIALTGAALFAVLDTFSPLVGVGARFGTGFGLGGKLVGGGVGVDRATYAREGMAN